MRLTEADEMELLALVEGELSPDQERAVLGRWQNQPEVIRLIEGMVADRAALWATPEVAAPAGLLNGVEAYMERQALLGDESGGEHGAEFSTGIERGTLISDRPPSLKIRPQGDAMAMIFSRYGALAAALAVAIGGAAYMMMPVRPSGAPVPPEASDGPMRIAMNDTDHAPASDAGLRREKTEISAKSASGDIASRLDSGERDSSGRATSAKDDSAATIAQAPAVPATLSVPAKATTALLASATTEISTDRALELARQGRLMVRVVAGNVGRAIDRAQDAARGHEGSPSLVGTVDASPADATLIAAAAESIRPLRHRASPLEGLAESDLRMLASDHPSATIPGSAIPISPVFIPRPDPLRAATSVDVRLSAEAIDSLRSVLTGRSAGSAGFNGVVEFIELPEPMTAPAKFDAGSALWWMQPPSAWAPRVRVPVVFEQP